MGITMKEEKKLRERHFSANLQAIIATQKNWWDLKLCDQLDLQKPIWFADFDFAYFK